MIDTTNSILKELARQKDQLGDLVTKGLLVLEEGLMSIVEEKSFDSNYKFKVVQNVRFVLKDKEYIAKLENELEETKVKLDAIRDALKL